MQPPTTQVLVIGGGPAGAAAGYWLARDGHDVTIVERKFFPREKTCGDGLTPRAVKQLHDMGLADALTPFHRYSGLRATGMGRELELEWPSHPIYPNYGYVVRRRDLDMAVAMHAEAAGATLLQGHEAVEPIMDRGFLRGATVKDKVSGTTREITARYVLVADGANSRFGRALGTFRKREWPYGTAIRTYWESPKHADPWIESALDVKDRAGNPLPGYGWIFPVGDGTINLGVGLLSTFRDFKSVNTSHLLDSYAHQIADRWGIDPDNPTQRPRRARSRWAGRWVPSSDRPIWSSATPRVGQPFNGEGIDYA
ncbi:MAG: geranylgeranyl reductase family protein [Ilumatobacteraceae bacterium]